MEHVDAQKHSSKLMMIFVFARKMVQNLTRLEHNASHAILLTVSIAPMMIPVVIVLQPILWSTLPAVDAQKTTLNLITPAIFAH